MPIIKPKGKNEDFMIGASIIAAFLFIAGGFFGGIALYNSNPALFNVACLVVGFLVFCGCVYYLVFDADKPDGESWNKKGTT